MKAKPKQKKENSERWLLTYSDLITLLMILFILLYAISNVDKEKYSKLSESLGSSMGQGASILGGSEGVLEEDGGDNIVDNGISKGVETPSTTPDPDESRPTVTATPTETPKSAGSGEVKEISGSLVNQSDMQNMENRVNQILKNMGIELSASTKLMESGLMISFNNDVFFDSGQDVLKEEMKDGLKDIAELLEKIDNSIIIEGHTDNVPIGSGNKYNSNWQLSAARAANVADYLVEKDKIEGSRISAIGYGEFRPIASNDTKEGRNKNRRVDIIILYNNRSELDYRSTQ